MTEAKPPGTGLPPPAGRPTVEEIRVELEQVDDPELGLSVIDLGLIYGVEIDEDGSVTVNMTLTTPACPVGPMLQGQIYHAVAQMDGVEDVEVNLVWEPPWDPRTMASDDVKLMLGIW